MIRFKYNGELKIASAIFYMNLAINKIAVGAKTIWDIIASCFGSGQWIAQSNWSTTDIWKNN